MFRACRGDDLGENGVAEAVVGEMGVIRGEVEERGTRESPRSGKRSLSASEKWALLASR
jgi:hypothetical protein